MAFDLPESESQTPDGVPLGWEAPWEKPQMMVVEEREGMAHIPRGHDWWFSLGCCAHRSTHTAHLDIEKEHSCFRGMHCQIF